MRLNTAIKQLLIPALMALGALAAPFPMVSGQTTPDDLKNQIDAKSKELEVISGQIKNTNDSINQLQGQKKTLSSAIKQFDYSINQVNLGIRSSEVTIDKLYLELQSLKLESDEIDRSIGSKREAIIETLKALQRKDREGMLHMLLKNASLVEGAFDIQALKDLEDVLLINVNDLNKLQAELIVTIGSTEEKKNSIESENLNLRNRKSILADQKQQKDSVLKEVKNQEGLYQKKLTALEIQQEAISNEISRIEEELRLKFDVSLLPQKRPGVFGWPILLAAQGGGGIITQHAGEVSRLYGGKPHNGLDIGVPMGTPVMAAESGTVVAVTNSPTTYGRYILIKHENNLATLYAHLSRQIVAAGQTVVRGQVIGYSGGCRGCAGAGYSTGPHLHFGVYPAYVPITTCSANIVLPILCLKSNPPYPIGPYIAPEGYL